MNVLSSELAEICSVPPVLPPHQDSIENLTLNQTLEIYLNISFIYITSLNLPILMSQVLFFSVCLSLSSLPPSFPSFLPFFLCLIEVQTTRKSTKLRKRQRWKLNLGDLIPESTVTRADHFLLLSLEEKVCSKFIIHGPRGSQKHSVCSKPQPLQDSDACIH